MEPKITTQQKIDLDMQQETGWANRSDLKWPEIWSLGALNAAIVICWIAYHEYQPKLLAGFGLTHLAMFLLYAKAIILVLIPPIAGLLTDYMIRKNKKVYVVFLAGIGGTAMIFMLVATNLFQGPTSFLTPILPLMVILWLIGMNVFHSPANSFIESFASARNLPIVMGVLVFLTELLYALEPIVVSLVDFFGAALTFIVGGVLIGVTGFIFRKVSRDEVMARKTEQVEQTGQRTEKSNFMLLVPVAFLFGLGHAFIVELLPSIFNRIFSVSLDGQYYSSFILFAVAILAIPVSRLVVRAELTDPVKWSIFMLIIAIMLIIVIPQAITFIAGSLLLVVSFSILSVTALPLAIRNLSISHLTLGVGIFFGIAAIADGIAEIFTGI